VSPANDPERDEVARAVGRALRRVRTSLGWSMRDAAAKAGMSQPFLSDLENGRATPSITTLYRLSDTLGVAPQDLLPPMAADAVVVRAGDGLTINPVDDTPGGAVSRLVAGGPCRIVEARRYSLSPGQSVGDWFEHEGEDLLFVVEGVVWVELGGARDVREERLATGDTLWHESLVPHRWRADETFGAELLLVNARAPGAASDSPHRS
jgi:quercetin dioxygenase-like cupin family protein/DNA-binding Xre family transcriptional regulator